MLNEYVVSAMIAKMKTAAKNDDWQKATEILDFVKKMESPTKNLAYMRVCLIYELQGIWADRGKQ